MRHGRPALLLGILALIFCAGVLAAGCGSDDETDTVTVTTTATEQTEATEATEATEPTETGEGTETDDGEPVIPPATGAKRGPNYFQTPSANIGCYIDARAARCDIRERDWKPTPEPASCKKAGLDYGQGLVVGEDHAEFICAGDTALGGPATLAYGQSAERGPFVCESEPDGVTCAHSGNGHGFFISRQSFRVF